MSQIEFKNGIWNIGECIETMSNIPDKSIDCIICDLPYGTTTCSWDTIIDFPLLWEQYKRIIKDNMAIVLFGQEPFSSLLRCSNLDWFKYDWYWKKARPSGFTNAKLKPLKDVEIISVFSNGKTANGSKNNMLYNPQGLEDCNIVWKRPNLSYGIDKGVNPTRKNHKLERTRDKQNYPRQILEYSLHNKGLLHPTQKPVDLIEYLVKTYTDENMIVLDNCAGSGSTAVACENTNRKWICIEKDINYSNLAIDRILENCYDNEQKVT